jgi:hypothetical protein
VVDVPRVIRRPVPEQELALGRSAEPVPLHLFPQPRDRTHDRSLGSVVALEILARGEETLHEECSLDQVGAVVETAEERDHSSCAAVQKVRPRAVKAVRTLQKRRDA